jgi:hypothetical protein
MANKNTDPNHRMGKTTGYDLINGEYHIAPLYQEQFNALLHEKGGIEDMLSAVTKHAQKDYEDISKREETLWERLAEDIGLDIHAGWTYRRGIVKPKAVVEGPTKP